MGLYKCTARDRDVLQRGEGNRLPGSPHFVKTRIKRCRSVLLERERVEESAAFVGLARARSIAESDFFFSEDLAVLRVAVGVGPDAALAVHVEVAVASSHPFDGDGHSAAILDDGFTRIGDVFEGLVVVLLRHLERLTGVFDSHQSGRGGASARTLKQTVHHHVCDRTLGISFDERLLSHVFSSYFWPLRHRHRCPRVSLASNARQKSIPQKTTFVNGIT